MYRTLLIIGLISLLGLTVLPTGSEAQDDGPARKLINSQGCKACHALEGNGGTMAGNFEEIRASRSRAEIRLQLVNQEQKHGKGAIPDFRHLLVTNLLDQVKFLQPEP